MIPIYFLVPTGANLPAQPPSASPMAYQVHAELQRILSSPLFSNSPRMCALLRFLVLQMLEGNAAKVSELAIGTAVFGRSAASYRPGADPVVRVQAGRLRRKLAAYYEHDGRNSTLPIVIPMGSYLPRIALPEGSAAKGAALTFQPLSCLSEDALAQSFTLGLNEELGHRLGREFGEQSGAGLLRSRVQQLRQKRHINYLIEGSVRQEGVRVRTSLRLIDRISGGIAWCEQLDHGVDLPAARQQQLAGACCAIVRQHLGMA